MDRVTGQRGRKSWCYLSILLTCSQVEQWKLLLNKKSGPGALLSLCCPHLHLLTTTHVVPVSSKAFRLGGSTVAVSLIWAFADIYSDT